jgi:hypothetical protein
LSPILSQSNPIQPLTPYLFQTSSNIALPSTPRSSEWSLPSSTFNQNFVRISHLLHACPSHLSILDLIILLIFGEE